MRELQFDTTWSDAITQIHQEHQIFIDRRLAPHVFSWYHQRTELIGTLLKKFAPDAKRLLDIGCAQGTIAITLGEAGYDVTGNDIREPYLAYARMRDDQHRVNFTCDNFLDFRSDQKFDAVIFTEVIEHIIDHSVFLRKIFECLEPNGILIVTTPNFDYVRQPLPSYTEVNFEENKAKEFSAHGSDHFYLFSKPELLDLLTASGFEVHSHEYFLPLLQDGRFKLSVLWRIFPARILEAISRLMDRRQSLCAQQCVVARRPLGEPQA
jgi:2-polyprenyl-3-methyl-5-hydroxy-6-metoxy-1,4-benzoquinol methylase